MNVLLYAPQYRPNMSSMIRSAEFYGFDKIYIYDKNDLLKPPTNKKGRANMEHLARVWTAGAIEFIEVIIVEDPIQFLSEYKGRIIGTLLDKEATLLQDFRFEEDDLVLFGSEKEGLDSEAIDLLNASIYIPAKGHTNCLNVAVSFGIVMNQAVYQVSNNNQ